MATATDDYARTLNAGFCALVSASLLQGTVDVSGGHGPGLPWAAPYLLMPFVLNEDTAARLSRSRARGLQEFLHHEPSVLVSFEQRARLLVPHVRAGLACALRRRALEFDPRTLRLLPTDALDGKQGRIREILNAKDADAITASRKLGRWVSAITFAYLCSLVSCRPALREVNYA